MTGTSSLGSNTLALLGGTPALTTPLRRYRGIGDAELAAAVAVLRSGELSGFIGAPGEAFYGGPAVRAFEAAWRGLYGVRHAISFNSATSGLTAAIAACRIGPGDEVIMPPYTMSATAMAALAYGGIPVFVDIEPRTFCLDPAAVAAAITPRTKAIVAVNLFGHPAELATLRALADARGLYLIEDNAQGPLAAEHGRYAGTIGHIGVFSLNYHKHIHSGEGGVCVTEDDALAQRLAIVRNHGENIVEALGLEDLTNAFGFNLRMTEVTAAIAEAQLHDAERHVRRRIALAQRLSEGIAGLEGLTAPIVRDGCTHSFYVWAMRFDAGALGVSRAQFSRALTAEGFPNYEGYVRPLYLLPLFTRRVAMGSHGFPFTLTNRTYAKGLCPVTERMHEGELLWFPICDFDIDDAQVSELVAAVRKVHAARATLVEAATR